MPIGKGMRKMDGKKGPDFLYFIWFSWRGLLDFRIVHFYSEIKCDEVIGIMYSKVKKVILVANWIAFFMNDKLLTEIFTEFSENIVSF